MVAIDLKHLVHGGSKEGHGKPMVLDELAHFLDVRFVAAAEDIQVNASFGRQRLHGFERRKNSFVFREAADPEKFLTRGGRRFGNAGEFFCVHGAIDDGAVHDVEARAGGEFAKSFASEINSTEFQFVGGAGWNETVNEGATAGEGGQGADGFLGRSGV